MKLKTVFKIFTAFKDKDESASTGVTVNIGSLKPPKDQPRKKSIIDETFNLLRQGNKLNRVSARSRQAHNAQGSPAIFRSDNKKKRLSKPDIKKFMHVSYRKTKQEEMINYDNEKGTGADSGLVFAEMAKEARNVSKTAKYQQGGKSRRSRGSDSTVTGMKRSSTDQSGFSQKSRISEVQDAHIKNRDDRNSSINRKPNMGSKSNIERPSMSAENRQNSVSGLPPNSIKGGQSNPNFIRNSDYRKSANFNRRSKFRSSCNAPSENISTKTIPQRHTSLVHSSSSTAVAAMAGNASRRNIPEDKMKRSSKTADIQYLRLEPEHQDLQMHRRKSFNVTDGSLSSIEKEMERVRRENLEKRLMNKTIHSQRASHGRPPSNRTSTIPMSRSPSHGFVRGHGGQSSGRSSLRYTEGSNSRASQSMRVKKISVGSRNIEPVSFQIG